MGKLAERFFAAKSMLMHAKKEALRYIILLYGICLTMGIPAVLLFVDTDPELSLFTLIYSFAPALLALWLHRRSGQAWRELGWVKPKWKKLLAILPVPLLYLPWLVLIPAYFGAVAAKPELPGLLAFVGNTLLSFLLLLVFIAGEEVGWRGYLQGRMTTAFGEVRGVLLLGLLWGLWHFPIALTGFNFPSYPWVEALVFYPIFCVALAFIIAYLAHPRIPLWTGLVFHAMHNATAGSIYYYFDFSDEHIKLATFLGCSVITALVFGLLYAKKVKTIAGRTEVRPA